MAFKLPSRLVFLTSNGKNYSYTHIPSKSHENILFLHGFPSTSYDWIYQIEYFSSRGYGIIAPDLLGYGKSSKPSDVEEYRLKPMSDDMIELLRHLDISKVIGIGHDFGATLLSRIAAYYPIQLTSLVFLAVGPPRLGTPFDVDMINQMTKQALGFEMLGYIPWLGSNTDAAITLESHAEAAMSLIFAADRKIWDEWFHPLGKMKQFVEENRRVPIGDWYSKGMRNHHLEAFGRENGYKGATRWYQMWMKNLFAPDEKGYEEFKISQPTLFIEPETDNPIQEEMLAEWTPNLSTERLDSGHWVHIERGNEVNAKIEGFLNKLETAS